VAGSAAQRWVAPARPVGTYVAYDRQGRVIWEKDGFVAGRDSVPFGISIVMGAGAIIDRSTGEIVSRWDPWGILLSSDL
jgi:hypothetical protein